MNTAWIVIAIVTVSYLGANVVFTKDRLPAAIRDVFLTGWEFFIVGVAIGPAGLNIISSADLVQLDPFIALGLGWAGLIFGSQFHYNDLKKIDPAMIRLTVAQAVMVGACLFFLCAVILSILMPVPFGALVSSSLAVAAAGAISSPTAISLMSSRFPKSQNTLKRALMIIATLDVGPALLVIGFVFLFFSHDASGQFSFGRGSLLLFYSMVISAALAGVFRLFDRDNLTDDDNLAVFIGFIIFISGIAFYLQLSPLFLSLLVGVFLANTLSHDDRIYAALHSTEKPFYVVLLVVSGMWWQGGGLGMWVMAIAITVARLWLKQECLNVASEYYLKDKRLPPNAGLGLGAQGSLALAIGLNFLIGYPGEVSHLVYGVIAICVIINEAMAPALIGKALGKS